MPERILRDITDSDRYNAVSPHARDLFIRLINKADDYGLLIADAKRLRPLLYPLLLETVREADLSRWSAECADAGLVRLYKTDEGREYLQIMRWRQRLRNKKPKYPLPPWGENCPTDDGHPSDRCRTNDGHPRSETETKAQANTDAVLAAIYDAYPRKVARPVALKAIEKAIAHVADEHEHPADWLMDQVRAYASAVKGGDPKFIPHPATWFNQQRYDDDHAEWRTQQGNDSLTFPPDPTAEELDKRMGFV